MRTEKDIQQWICKIDDLTGAFKSQFGSLSETELNFMPDSKAWSIAQNIEHLITVNETYYPVIKSIRENRYKVPFIGRIGFMVRFFGNLILNSVKPDRTRKIKTFSIWEPSRSKIEGDILQKFTRHQEELKQFIKNNTDLILRPTIISSPVNRKIVYTFDKAIEIIITHEQRHFEQAKLVLDIVKR